MDKNRFDVREIQKFLAKPWILKRHYAHRMPSVSYCYGLYMDNELVGVCTFGVTFNYAEENEWKGYDVYELNRLITDDNLPRNSLSYFVSKCLRRLPSPCVIISYADSGKNHHGYIYQATNFIYTGMGGKGKKLYKLNNGKWIHQRSLENPREIKEMKENGRIVKEKRTEGKHRYYYFIGNKWDKRKMREILEERDNIKEKPYPKGKNERYDTGEVIDRQGSLEKFVKR